MSDKLAFASLKERLDTFNRIFIDLRKTDHIDFYFLKNGQTRVTMNGRQVGRVKGLDFQKALLAVWLGDKPADGDLKQAMLRSK